jgi:hypothetical protein
VIAIPSGVRRNGFAVGRLAGVANCC